MSHRLFFSVGPLLSIALFMTENVVYADFAYDNFTDVSSLTLNGAASQVGGDLRLTTATTNNFGSAYTTTEVPLGNDGSFSTHFQFQLTDPGGVSDADGAGGDGLMFVLQTDSNTALENRLFGYSTLPGKSLGIEFDTFYNSSTSDPNGNHVGIDLDGSVVSAATAVEPVRFNNSEIWNAWVDYNGATNELDVRWSLSDIAPVVPQLTYSIDLKNQLGGGAAFVGFSADSEGAWENADIKNWQFSSNTVVPEPSSLQIWSAIAVALGATRRKRTAEAKV